MGTHVVSLAIILSIVGATTITCLQQSLPFGSNNITLTYTDPVDATFDLLEKGAQNVSIQGAQNEVVLAIGNTGSGKSTLVTLLAFGNHSTLESEKVGRGNYIIIDNSSDRIANTTLTSKTLYPELIHSRSDNIDYYDCPGFADTRGMAEDIAATYFTKLVVDSAAAVKFLIVASYSGLKPGNSRTDLSSLIDHVSEFIKDIPKYNQSIAFIATKVEDRNGYADEDIIGDIGDFIKEEGGNYAKGKLDVSTTDEEAKLYKNAIALIDAITTTDENGNYNRIGIFKQPTSNGSLNDMEVIQKGNDYNRKIVKNIAIYQPKENSDFGYSISDKTRGELGKFVQRILSKISNTFEEITSSLQKQLSENIKNSLDWKSTLTTLEDRYQDIKDTLAKLNIEKTGNPKIYVDTFGGLASKLGDFSEQEFEQIRRLAGYLEFLEVVSMNNGSMTNMENPLEGVGTEYTKSINWYRFLLYTQTTLSAYKYQKDRNAYNVADLSNWGKTGHAQGTVVTSNNLNTFSKLVGYSGESPDPSDDHRLNDLRALLKSVIQDSDVAQDKTDDTLIIKGTFVHISNITNLITANMRTVEIFGLNTIFIDQDLTLPSVNVSLMAPRIEVINTQQINLNGNSNQESYNKADKAKTGQSGTNGEPGKPGGNGGNFMALFSKSFINQENLKITANGGKGGNGQDGQDGGDGVNGTEPSVPDDALAQNSTLTDYDKYPEGVKGINWIRLDKEESYVVGFLGNKMKYHFRVFGSKGEDGHTGGDGGAGGNGGHAGSIEILSTDGAIYTKMKSREGQRGNPGIGGQGGSGGQDGQDRLVKFVRGFSAGIHWKNFEDGGLYKDPKKYEDGKNGEKGGNSQDIDNPATPMSKKEWAKQLNHLKSYFRTHAVDPKIKNDLTTYLTGVESNENLSLLYGAEELLADLIELEKQYFSLYEKMNLIDYYQSLIDRTEAFVRNPSSDLTVKGANKALAYLLTSAIGKTAAMKQGLEKNLIIDLKEYIDKLARKNIEDLNNAKKEDAIKQHRENYTDSVNDDIKEANNFITKDMQTAINSTIEEMNKETTKLIEETKNLTKKGETSKKELQEKQKALQKNMIISSIFGVLKIVGSVAACTGPQGVAAGAVLGAVTTIAEPLVLDDKANSETLPLNIPKGVKEGISAMSSFFKERKDEEIKALNLQIEKINEILKLAPETSQNMTKKIKIIEEKLFKAENNSNLDGSGRIGLLQKELKDLFESKKGSLEHEFKMSGYEGSMDKLEKFGKYIEVGSATFEFVNKYQKDAEAVKLAGDAITGAENEIVRLHEFEASIYSTLIPMLSNMNQNVKDMEKSLGTKSQVGLEVSKWKIQSALKEILDKIQKMTKGFQVEEQFVHSIEKLKEALTTVINIYDRIQALKEKKELADYIANIESAGSLRIELDINSPYNNYITEMDQIIQSNLILLEFEQITSAFRQWVFPFADLYQDIFYLQPTNGENATDKLVVNAVSKITKIQKYLNLDKTTITKLDKFIDSGSFGQDNPFFKWSDEEYHNEISNQLLLKGDTITLYADIAKAPPERSAIKFSKVNLVLKLSSANKTFQNDFTDFLNGYQVILTHTGNSYYEFGGKIYLIDTKEQVFSHSFKKNSKGEPDTVDNVYKKILAGDLLLSPYCFWTIQILKLHEGASGDFSEWIDYGVDAYLIGEGKYIAEKGKGQGLPPLHLDKYYHLVGY